jgi:hypothetical protein
MVVEHIIFIKSNYILNIKILVRLLTLTTIKY